MFDVFLKGLIVFLVIFLILCLTAAWFDVKKTSEQTEKCEIAGGVPYKARGTNFVCMKPDNFIKIN